MLTGMLEASGGDASVYGLSAVNDMASIHRLMGVCPQENVAFDYLTVEDHLRLYGAIKGLTGAALDARVATLLRQLALADKAGALARHLSGGQVRRLCLAVALVGEPRVLYLDEPTSGLDPASRRAVWELLRAVKRDRVVVLTTHFMDEADILGDRIALMSSGRLRACGSSLFMKSVFGVGYRMTATVAPGGATSPLTAAAPLLAAVQEAVPGAFIDQVNNTTEETSSGGGSGGGGGGVEVDIVLPRDSADTLAAMLDTLERGAETLGLRTYSLRMPTMEEVFLRLSKLLAAAEGRRDAGTHDAPAAVVAAATAAENAAAMPWYDVRRRDGLTAAAAAARPETDGACSVLRCRPSRTRRHIALQLWRLTLAARRDVRSVWLQVVTPLLFVGAGIILVLLRNVGGVAPAASVSYTPAQYVAAAAGAPGGNFSLPLAVLAGSAGWVSSLPAVAGGGAAWPAASAAPGAPAVPLVPGASSDTLSSVQAWAAAREWDSAAVVLDATAGTPPTGPLGATILYNTSLTNSIPVTLSLLHSALLAGALGTPSPAPELFVGSFAPLRYTAGGESSSVGSFLSLGLLGFLVAAGFNTLPAIQVRDCGRGGGGGGGCEIEL